MNQQPLCEACLISKDFPLPHKQSLHVLENISLTIYPNEVLAIIGPSGCGKSTLLRVIAGLIPATSGHILYQGHSHEGLLPDMAIVFQNFALYPWMTIKENIGLALIALNMSAEESEKKITQAISLIGLSGFEEAYPREISGGMKQRVGIARALVKNPKLLFMDEPFSSVDAFTAESLRAEVLDIWAKKDTTLSSIVLISHDIQEVAYMADRIIILDTNPGRIRSVISNPLPRPRNLHSTHFLNFLETLHDLCGHKELTATPHKENLISPLLPVSLDEIAGFLEYLSIRGDDQDLYEIGATSLLHFDKVILVTQAAELLQFIEVSHNIISLTPQGKAYIEASDPNRRILLKNQLLETALFAKIQALLSQTPDKALEKQTLIDFLIKLFPHQDAQVQFNILIRWGKY
ncbi:MAG: nitrate/sulfonate/bicarbonate ABC transporter ATP-binding protein, partial [Chlamydiota bacterium]